MKVVAAVELSREIGAARAFREFRRREVMPGPRSRAEMAAWIRQATTCFFHPTSSCRMGVDERAVVDPRLRVHGLAGLRVADASIMSEITSGPTNAPAILIGEQASRFILGQAPPRGAEPGPGLWRGPAERTAALRTGFFPKCPDPRSTPCGHAQRRIVAPATQPFARPCEMRPARRPSRSAWSLNFPTSRAERGSARAGKGRRSTRFPAPEARPEPRRAFQTIVQPSTRRLARRV